MKHLWLVWLTQRIASGCCYCCCLDCWTRRDWYCFYCWMSDKHSKRSIPCLLAMEKISEFLNSSSYDFVITVAKACTGICLLACDILSQYLNLPSDFWTSLYSNAGGRRLAGPEHQSFHWLYNYNSENPNQSKQFIKIGVWGYAWFLPRHYVCFHKVRGNRPVVQHSVWNISSQDETSNDGCFVEL